MKAALLLLAACSVHAEALPLALDVPPGLHERHYSDAVAVALDGRRNVAVPFGYVDVVTDGYAIEVDRPHHWREAIGQAIVYAEQLGLRPGLVLIEPVDPALLSEIERVCEAIGVRVWTA